MTARPQPIAGVSAGRENLLRAVYPSISATGMGRLLGRLMDSVPIGIGNVRLSYLIFGLPVAALSLPGYLGQKVTGERYVLTNRGIRRWAALGSRMIQGVELTEIGDILTETLPGQEFYHAADLIILGKDGRRLMRLAGVPRAEIFRETILKAAQARVQVEESLARIRGRQSATAR